MSEPTMAQVVEYIFVLGGILFLPVVWFLFREQSKRERVLRRTLQAYAKALLAAVESKSYEGADTMISELKRLIDEPEVAEIFDTLPEVDLDRLREKNVLDFYFAIEELARLPSKGN